LSSMIVTYPTFLDTLRPAVRIPSRVIDTAAVVTFSGLTAGLAQLHIALGFTPVPITGQTLAVMLAGTSLGWWRGALSQLLYWLAGIFMPFAWYADDKSGASIAAGWRIATGATAGYLAGFVIAAALVGLLAQRGQDRTFLTSFPAMLAGSAIIYVLGVGWLAFDLGVPVATGKTNAIGLGLAPFLVGDAIKVLLAGGLTPFAWRLVGKRS
jgi:biotin transport system substrate-specific component